MKKLQLILVLCLSVLGLNAQIIDGNAPANEHPDVLTMAEVMPEFPGGNEEMYKFIGNNIKYPFKAKEAGIEGTVYTKFIVTNTGDITNIEIIKGASEDFDMEVLRMMKLMPRWNPGMQNGRPVSVYFTLPVKFILNEGKKSK